MLMCISNERARTLRAASPYAPAHGRHGCDQCGGLTATLIADSRPERVPIRSGTENAEHGGMELLRADEHYDVLIFGAGWGVALAPIVATDPITTSASAAT
jgi:hypothetical protein